MILFSFFRADFLAFKFLILLARLNEDIAIFLVHVETGVALSSEIIIPLVSNIVFSHTHVMRTI